MVILGKRGFRYVDSIVLGLNDALVELTGALAGFTLALQNTKLIASAGLIMGIAAALSMAASEYLSKKSERDSNKKTTNPLRAAVYTGIAYLLTVLILVLPFFIVSKVYYALGFTIFNSLVIISLFTFYMHVAKGVSFKKRFFEMAGISLSVAAISFVIGLLVRNYLGIEI
jgi:vacuolar iron transporter family protein